MLKSFTFYSQSFLITVIIFFFQFAGIAQTNSDSKSVSIPSMPENIYKIIKHSCIECHSGEGNIMAIAHLDFDRWEKYKLKKKIKKADKMCDMITQEKMPPKKARTQKPEIIPTKDEIQSICNWSAALKESQLKEKSKK